MSCCSCHHDKPHGSGHWLMERLTSVALVPLGLWIVFSAVALRGATHADFTVWLSTPMNTWLVVASIVIGFWHGIMGLQVIIEDYRSEFQSRGALICLVKLFFGALALVCLYSVYKIAF